MHRSVQAAACEATSLACMAEMTTLPTEDLTALFQAIVDIESVSRNECALANAVEATLQGCAHLEILRDGDAIIARTNLACPERVIIAGHLDTVPVAGNLPSKLVDGVLFGRGTVDMKGGVAVMTQLAVQLAAPTRDITWVFYDREEIASAENGLGRLAANHPEWLAGDLAILMEPTSAQVEAGCQGTIRVDVTTRGLAAHSARAWMGHNAIHDIAEVVRRVVEFDAGPVDVDGLTYREGLNVTMINGGVAGNVIPDACVAQVNFRFAPDKSTEQAVAILRELFAGFEQDFVDISPAARPGLNISATQDFIKAVGDEVKVGPKYGWTDVARFSALGIAALNYGPGDANKAHADDESCPVEQVELCATTLRRWLTAAD